MAANRNGGMLRLIASRHDDDDDDGGNTFFSGGEIHICGKLLAANVTMHSVKL